MLTNLNIHNFAVVDHLELELSDQLSVLTGETGAGKSILIDALGLVLGDRADTGFIRHGANKAEINAIFDIENNTNAKIWLIENEIDTDNECIIRRTISKDGRSRAYINGQPLPIQSLRKLGEMLIDIHGQHEHQSLMQPGLQRQAVDDFARHRGLLEKLASIYNDWQILDHELQSLDNLKQDREARLQLLQYQVEELDELSLQESELAELDNELKRLSNANLLVSSTEKILFTLYEDETDSVYNKLTQINHELERLKQLDDQLSPALDLLSQSCIQINEAVTELRQYSDPLEADPERLLWVEQRLISILDLSRKHQVKPIELIELHEQLANELKTLKNADIRLEEIANEVSELKAAYLKVAASMTTKRKKAAKKLEKQITSNMQKLGMEGGRFEIKIEPLAADNFKATGMDRITFLVSANPGQPLQSLTKVASGGELSRISLAIQAIIARDSAIPTLIFDEVDTGVGGAVAEMVGHLLRKLGEDRQIICVTHLPQVASLAHHHYSVNKLTEKENTRTQISQLLEKERVNEIARMLGGIKMTKQTLSHAREMIDQASRL